MTIVVELHGRLGDGAGPRARELSLDAERCTVADAVERACRAVPGLADGLGGVAFAIGDRLVHGTERLEDGDVLSLLPPVSGG